VRLISLRMDLRVAPQDLYESEVFEYLSEYTLVRAWMSQWLKYIRWYYTVAVAPDLSFEDFIKAPVVTTHGESPE